MADWKKLLVENPPASDIASSPSSGKVLKVSSNGTGLEWADDAGGAFSDNGTLASVTDRIVTIQGSSSAIPTLDINPPLSVSTTSYSRIRVQTSGRDLRFNLRNGSSTSDVMTIAHNGSVGIGKTDPSYQLDISNNGGSAIRLARPNYATTIIESSSLGGLINVETNHDFRLFTNNTERMRILSGGNVGIGTSSPSQLLHIESSSFPTALIKGGSSGAILRLQGANNDYIAFHDNTSDKWLLRYQPGANKIDFLNNGLSSSALTILDSNNNIGIGTVSPSAKLHILAGNNNDAIRVTGADANYYGSLHYTNASTTTFNILNSYSANNASAIKLGFGSVSSNTNVMTLLKSGKIGIGTSSPSLSYNSGLHIKNASNVANLKVSSGSSTGFDLWQDTGGNAYVINHDNAGILFKTNGGDRVYIKNDGKVGIGTNSPVFGLDVRNTGYFATASSSNQLTLGDTTNGTTSSFNTTNNVLSFKYNGSATGMALTSTGLGIGTSSPQEKLDISAGNIRLDNQYLLTFADTDANTGRVAIQGDEGSDYLRFRTDNANRMAITNSGVGIGTLSPSEKLHVNGNIKAGSTSRVFFNTNSTGIGSSTVNQLDVFSFGDMNISTENSSTSISFKPVGTTRFKLDTNSRISLSNNDAGDKNIIFGERAGNSIVSGGDQNNLFGYQTGYSITTGDYNVAIGNYNSYFNQTGSGNTAIGTQSMQGASSQSHSNNTSVGYQSLYSITTGGNNTAVGYLALNDNTSAGNNVAIGADASHKGTTANKNVAVGNLASYFNQTGLGNVSIGYEAMKGSSGTSHSNNVAIGYQSMYPITTGGNNVGVGYQSLRAITSGGQNTGIGTQANYSVTTGVVNTALGNGALFYNQTGNYNTAIGGSAMFGASSNSHSNNTAVGYKSLHAITTASANVAIGKETLYSTTTGGSNTALGHQAMYYGTESDSNVAVGQSALEKNVTGDDNTAIGYQSQYGASGQSHSNNTSVGYQSLKAITTGGKNNSIGYKSGFSNTTGFNNQYFGYQSGYYNTTGRSNIAIGYNSQFGSSGLTTGAYNVSLGENTLSSLTTGNHNFAVGSNAGLSLTGGEHNVIIGSAAGDALTTTSNTVIIGRASGSAINSTGANGSVLIGAYAGNALTSASNTVAIGMNAMIEHTTGNLNTVVGSNAMNDSNGHAGYANSFYGAFSGAGGWAGASHSNTAVGSHSFGGGAKTATAVYNTTVGRDSLYALTSGHNNSAYGYRSGNAITSGDANSTFGFQSGITIADGRRNTIIGSGSDVSASGALNQIVLGEGQTGVADNTAIIGNSAVTDVYMGDNGSAWSTTSDGRLKENIEEWSTGLDAINKLRVVEYNFKENNPHKYDHKKKRQGIIAQEAIEAIPEMIKDDGEWLSANQEPMIWALVNAVKELTKKVNELETKLNKEN